MKSVPYDFNSEEHLSKLKKGLEKAALRGRRPGPKTNIANLLIAEKLIKKGMSIKQACKFINVNRATFYKYRVNGKIILPFNLHAENIDTNATERLIAALKLEIIEKS